MSAFKAHQYKEIAQTADEDGWQGFWPTMLFALMGVIALVVLSYRPPTNGEGVGMVFPLSMSEDEILAQVGAAGGRVARFGGFGHMAVVFRDDGKTAEADQFGALFTLSPMVLSACFETDDTPEQF